MDLNRLLIWLVCISCIANLLSGLRRYQAARGWVLVSGLILGLMASLGYSQPQNAGLFGGSVWAIFVLLPLISLRRSQALAARYRFQGAAWWATVGCFFHPLDGWWIYPDYLGALALAQAGKTEAIQRLNRLKAESSGFGPAARCNLFRIHGDWAGLRTWIEQEITLDNISRTPYLISFYLQALGEMNALNLMIETLERFQSDLQTAGANYWSLGQMIVFAYCGQPTQVSQLLQNKASRDSQFWRATAQIAAAESPGAQDDIAAILESQDLLYCGTLKQRDGQREFEQISDQSRQLLLRWSEDLNATPKQQLGPVSLVRSPVTLTLIGLNVIMFLIEVQRGGSTDPYTLYQLGALVPADVVAGAWWRLLAATFLHFGVMHLAFNMLALAVLGPFVEQQLGTVRFSIMYLAAGVGSMLTLTILVMQGLSPTEFAVGASGAVMGVIGAEAAILLTQWRRSRIAQQRLQRIFLIVALQTFFDITTPQISLIG
ncbi:MAG: rhomboid family intramembrane serine protease, partial [Thermosynechococcaceae cyanobacterium]